MDFLPNEGITIFQKRIQLESELMLVTNIRINNKETFLFEDNQSLE